MTGIAVAAIALLTAVMLPRFVSVGRFESGFEAMEQWLRRYGAWAAAVSSIAVVWFVWGEILPTAKIQDESSYLLQSHIFASGRWTIPSPPIPEFFEQPHVLVVPAVASKYPPGHALLLSIGSLVRFPPLVPLLLAGVTAWLLFALALRVSNAWVALLTWLLWATASITLRFQSSYLSEVTTGALMLASWWCLLEWRDTRARRWLLLLALAIGWSAITRPLTSLAIAVPIGVVVLLDTVRQRGWKDLGLAVGVGVAVLAILPLWSAQTTGDWREWPVERYRVDYIPWDKPGFTADSTPPRRAGSAVIQSMTSYFLQAHAEHTPAALPGIVSRRVLNLATGFFQNLRLPLLVFAIAGLFAMPRAAAFALGTALLHFAAYVMYAHDPYWTAYYLETAPAVAMLVALGLWRAARWAARGDVRAPLGAVAALGVLVAIGAPAVRDWRADHAIRSAFDRRFARSLTEVEAPAIVFLRYSPRLAIHPSVVFNRLDPERAPVWVVHDLGARNAELLRLAPERRGYRIDEGELLRWAVDERPRPLPLRALAPAAP